MQKKNVYIIIIIVAIVILGGYYFVFQKAKPSNSANNLSVTQLTTSQNTILLGDNKSLKFLTDAKGMTLYHDTQDWPKNTKPPYIPYSKCTDTCSVTWPPFYTDAIKISAPLKADDFTVFTRTDGKNNWLGGAGLFIITLATPSPVTSTAKM